MKKLVLLFLVVLLNTNCAGFKNPTGSGNFNKNNLSEIDGTYKNISSSGTETLTEVFDRDTNIFAFLKGGDNKYDKIKDVKLILKIINNKRLNVKIIDSDNLLFDKNLKVKLKKDGFLYLREKQFMIEGIPFVAGGWNVQKSCFTIDKNHNLQVQLNYFFYMAILVVISDAKTTNSYFTFEKTIN